MFDLLVRMNCHSRSPIVRWGAAQLLEKLYGCEIRCEQMARSVRFAHHARGCTIVAAKIDANVVLFQNVTVGSNLKFNKTTSEWENVGNPILARGVLVADGAKILGPVVVGAHSVVAAGAIVTKDVPPRSLAYGVNQFRPLDERYDLIFSPNMIQAEEMVEANRRLVARFLKNEP